jgi:23S rRNA pseudouridine1911/1915/1917 synthase
MSDPLETETFRVEPEDAGARLDAFLVRRAGGLSRSRLKALIEAGQVQVGGAAATDANRRLAAGDEVALAVPEAEPAEPEAEDIPLEVVYEDSDLIVIDKPPGLVVHPGSGNWTGTLVNALIHHCGDSLSGIGGVKRPGIVHRLDKDTSGLLVVAKTDAAHQSLAAQFADHGRSGPLVREYDALVWRVPDPQMGIVDAPLDRDSRNRQKQAVKRSGGRHAVTRYALREAFGTIASLVSCRLETGRTHQIRVHMAHIGHPLVGDAVYGSGFLSKAEALPVELKHRVKAFSRQALHARLLGFQHPRTGESLLFEADQRADMAALIEAFRKHLV